ncbi:MAG: DMT family transporter [Alphaproteobacteria bacterium]
MIHVADGSALIAAFLNGSIGALSRYGFYFEATHHQLAFYKCFFAFLLLLTLVLLNKTKRREFIALHRRAKEISILAGFGIFSLYFFETWAFAEANIPLVSFLTYASGGVTILLASFILNEALTLPKICAFLLMVFGILLMSITEIGHSGSMLGFALACAGGIGYSLFLLLSKFYKMPAGIVTLTWFFGFGSVYLFIPMAIDGVSFPNFYALGIIFLLVLFPTIGGYYFTMRALQHGEASKVQIIETSDPLFASLFAFILFGDMLTGYGMIGAALIFTGLLVAITGHRLKLKAKKHS